MAALFLGVSWCATGVLLSCGGARSDLSEAQLSAVVARERPGLERCYRGALESHPYEHDINMEAVITIAPAGDVESVALKGGGGLPGMSPCLLATLRSWRFPVAKDTSVTSLPIIFRPEIKEQVDPAAMQEAVRGALGAAANP
jgi:hypothetical protein